MLYSYFYIQDFSYFSVLFLNIFIYLFSITTFFLIFFFFDLNNYINLNSIKNFSSNNFLYISIILTFLSLSGMPPMSGFCGKFIFSIFFLLKSNLFYFILFVFINLFLIYFYMQNFRFLIKKTSDSSNFFNTSSYYLINYNLLSFIVFLLILNLFSIFFLNEIYLIFHSLLFF